MFVGHLEAERAHEMQLAPRRAASAHDIARVLRNFGLDQNYIEQFDCLRMVVENILY
jgi:hypothetical protein